MKKKIWIKIKKDFEEQMVKRKFNKKRFDSITFHLNTFILYCYLKILYLLIIKDHIYFIIYFIF